MSVTKLKTSVNENHILGAPDAVWKSPYAQQGDVLIKKIGKHDVFEVEHTEIPEDAKPTGNNVVFKGTQNTHALFEGDYDLLKSGDTLFLRVREATILDHVKPGNIRMRAEHYALWVPPGEYFFDGVREQDHVDEEARRVIDQPLPHGIFKEQTK